MIFFIGCKDTDKLIGKSLCINRENHGKGGFYHTTFAVWINTKTFYYEKDVSCFRLLLAVLVMGCGIYESYGFDYKQLSSIERGMSFKEVCTILGEPAFRDLNKEGEAWTFRAYTPAGWSAVKVWFKDGKVDEMKSYLEDTYPVTTSRDKSFMNEKKESSDKSSETKVIVSPEGKHYIKMGSVVVTPEGKHIIVP